ncbi:MAG: methylated-DNA--[protein]-cysteine S-methyltransferase [Actinobacteria bacterium]|nr:methylated-DNA--[protein]-cysteine S-methyltransferase [Actinomycetota bacterium]
MRDNFKISKIKLYYFNFKTEIGEIYYIWCEYKPDFTTDETSDGNNFFINFIGLGENSFKKYLDKAVKNFFKSETFIIKNKNKFIENEIAGFLEGKSKKINLTPCFLTGGDFEKLIWSKTAAIPFGKTISYKELAALAGKPFAFRAAGNALGKNPLLLLVPCHRVIKSNGETGNFGCGVKVKKFLLDLES